MPKFEPWTRFELTFTTPDGSVLNHRGWCRQVEVVNGHLNIMEIKLVDLHIGSTWSHVTGEPPVQPPAGGAYA